VIARPSSFPRIAASATVALLLVAGCAKKNTPTVQPSPTPTSSPRPASPAKVELVEPQTGAMVPAGTLHVKLTLTGARIVDFTSKDIKPDEGHIHLLLDGKVVSMTLGLEQDIEAPAGSHLLEAEFVAADHVPFNPRVHTSVTFKSQ
jgi:hypothetical protein